MKASELLKRQHREVKKLFAATKKAEDAATRRSGLDEIALKLSAHMTIEEAIFYPAVAELGTKKLEDLVPESYEEHHVAKLVLAELPDVDPTDERFKAKVTVLSELIDHHVEEEEHEMFPAAEKLGDDRLQELGAEMETAFKAEIGEDEVKSVGRRAGAR